MVCLPFVFYFYFAAQFVYALKIGLLWLISCTLSHFYLHIIQLATSKRGMENNCQLYELDGHEALGSYLEIQPCSDNAPELSKCSIQWYRVSSEGKKELISGILVLFLALPIFDLWIREFWALNKGRICFLLVIKEWICLLLTCPLFLFNLPNLRCYQTSLCPWTFWCWAHLASWYYSRRTDNYIDNYWSYWPWSGFYLDSPFCFYFYYRCFQVLGYYVFHLSPFIWFV